ncbi:MAG TPA: hypothetical protein VNQ74_01375 [Burkholderiaceae bacterium]|nr:hypothetical protein [Burkholderiaceae bacterium]
MNFPTVVLGQRSGFGQLFLADDPPLDEKIAQVFFCHGRTARLSVPEP